MFDFFDGCKCHTVNDFRFSFSDILYFLVDIICSVFLAITENSHITNYLYISSSIVVCNRAVNIPSGPFGLEGEINLTAQSTLAQLTTSLTLSSVWTSSTTSPSLRPGKCSVKRRLAQFRQMKVPSSFFKVPSLFDGSLETIFLSLPEKFYLLFILRSNVYNCHLFFQRRWVQMNLYVTSWYHHHFLDR